MLKFRNLNVTPEDSIEDWGVEGLLIAIERGSVDDWRRVAQAAHSAGSGSELRQELNEALDIAEGGGRGVIVSYIGMVEESSAERVQRRIRNAFGMAEMTITEFAKRCGTSRSRMSAYLSGKTEPLATMLEKMEQVARNRRDMIMFR
ncbi:helix-turn-helix transcriptional regulator [Leucobacter viscericola]|uniref:Helix-turn-helix transcriptional regulator n=1 Tax=Leucobacter viscericola TaxID=2714935 RepID=A0A6G7XFV9_9MICO|nr:helix-turn-helix transcriptional regulator [Leucobacter viscericola]QIK63500.1 helix-turn-helix transcriptional regulator [Leucobacter viscericola]